MGINLVQSDPSFFYFFGDLGWFLSHLEFSLRTILSPGLLSGTDSIKPEFMNEPFSRADLTKETEC